ncbi:MAG TPA: amylo-alpha-1,6-glucosidase [Abditibacteriaceae bacterium]|jgi:predicted glycogen debranching enzyme
MNFDLSREWLESNGIGGYACGTVVGSNTRRYHALLCAATRPPLGRAVLVNKADETLVVGDRQFELGCNQYPGTIHPTGYAWLDEFSASPLPSWTFRVPGATLRKTLWMPHGENRVVVRYDLLEGEAQLAVRPFVSGRDYHGTHRFNDTFASGTATWHETAGEAVSQHVQMQPYAEWPPIVWTHDGEFMPGGAWYYSFELEIERERGLDDTEDWWCPGAWCWKLSPENPTAWWTIATEPAVLEDVRASQQQELHRRVALNATQSTVEIDRTADATRERLVRACDQFIVRREDGLNTVLAGYPWFSDWGRDTMIALPGLCLSTGRFADARSILTAFARAMSQGMIPNRFVDAGETPDTNTVDATLWFFHAIARYIEATDDEAALREWYPALLESFDWHLRGTRFGIRADENDGLLSSGAPDTQLTWMDAKVGDAVFTPRDGKPVEIQALWYGALREMDGFAARMGDTKTRKLCATWSRLAKRNFAPKFWNEAENCLFDCIRHDGTPDGAIRPNQIFAVSLPHRLLSVAQEKAVVATVQRELLTPHGLRSLSPRDSAYRSIYIGDQWQRDSSYHQGTVWGWLIGPFVSAYLRANRGVRAKAQARAWLVPLVAHLDQACIGSVSEVFDGDAPHAPRGCFAQAWSVSELLRAWDETA